MNEEKKENTQRNYLGGVWKITTENPFYNVSLKTGDIEKLVPDDKGLISLTISERKAGPDPDKKLPTHNVYENLYKSKGIEDEYAQINILLHKDDFLAQAKDKDIVLVLSSYKNSDEKKKDNKADMYLYFADENKEKHHVGVGYSIEGRNKQQSNFVGVSFKDESAGVTYLNTSVKRDALLASFQEDKKNIWIGFKPNQAGNGFTVSVHPDIKDKDFQYFFSLNKEKLLNTPADEKGDVRFTGTQKKESSIMDDKSNLNCYTSINKEKSYIGKGYDRGFMEKYLETFKKEKPVEKKNVNSKGIEM